MRVSTTPASRSSRFILPAISSLAAVLILAILAGGSYANPQGPKRADRQVTAVVADLLPARHLSRHELDDEMSRRMLDNYLETLDPMRLYFYESDVAAFRRWQDDLDDQVRRGDVRFAHDVYAVFLARLEERVKMVDELVKLEHDFTQDEYLDTDFDNRPYVRDALEARERWRRQIKYDLLRQRVDDVEPAAAREKILKRYRSFASYKQQADNEDILETYLSSLTRGYDPHTSYMSSKALKNFEIMMGLQLDGIGASLKSEDGETVVHRIIPGGAADKDGRLKANDRVIGVGQGTEGPIEDVVNMRLDDVVNRIRGKAGTVVRLQVTDEKHSETQIYAITRAKIKLEDHAARGEVIEDGSKPDGTPYKVGVINLPSFYMDMDPRRRRQANYKSTTADVKRLLEDFKAQEVDAVMVDLRRNGGGSLTEAINLTGLFIDEGPVVQIKTEDGDVRQYDDVVPGTTWDGPLVVLTSKFSASASEIFAGAVQDYRRGLIVGDYTTHGKGTVQNLLDLGQQVIRFASSAPNWGALKVTIQQFYRPSGDSTQNRGVLSDVELPSLTTHLDVGEADLQYAMAFDSVEPAPFDAADMIHDIDIAQLRARSEQRLQASDDFAKVRKRIARYKQQKEEKRITLNEERYLAERKELDDETEKETEEVDEADNPVVERDYYFDEAMAVTIDFVKLSAGEQLAQIRRETESD
ncbi:MAG: tail-specific protease [Planctomycetota bacterium]|nr:MAG: tail-specific protease [Planctomycetota bacterium]REJ92360.1 MAG: tail-specific protease [Planctomycetota bacterium]REK30248.1 MAG: tail-specific protease [Planctomycetota bacterium]REK44579.1 MAG: tail-specific protease [Planctomycetota bacterium]